MNRNNAPTHPGRNPEIFEGSIHFAFYSPHLNPFQSPKHLPKNKRAKTFCIDSGPCCVVFLPHRKQSSYSRCEVAFQGVNGRVVLKHLFPRSFPMYFSCLLHLIEYCFSRWILHLCIEDALTLIPKFKPDLSSNKPEKVTFPWKKVL